MNHPTNDWPYDNGKIPHHCQNSDNIHMSHICSLQDLHLFVSLMVEL